MSDDPKDGTRDDFYEKRFGGSNELEELFFVGTPFERPAPVARQTPALKCVVNNDKSDSARKS